MRTSNPALSSSVFEADQRLAIGEGSMTLSGTINKSFVLLLLLLCSASFTWYYGVRSGLLFPLMMTGLVGGFIVGLVTVFKRSWAPYTAWLYALLEGLFLGAISYLFEEGFKDIVSQAILLTLGVFVSLLLAYRSGLIKVTDGFKKGVIAVTGAIALVYLITFIMSFFGSTIPYIHGNGLIGIGFSLVVVVVASLNLVLDFDFIHEGVNRGAPKYMEWYASFGLLVTLIWLYIAILRLLSKLRSR